MTIELQWDQTIELIRAKFSPHVRMFASSVEYGAKTIVAEWTNPPKEEH